MALNVLKAISTFVMAVELGSIRKAALAQGVTSQAASQTIVQLERHLGVRLLHRTTRSLALTEEGQRFLENTEPALAAIDWALVLARESKDEIAGPLRIVGPRTGLPALLMPILEEFCGANPRIQADVQLDDGLGNWVESRVDVGFRLGAGLSDGVIGRVLFPIQMIVCASPAYVARHGIPGSLNDLAMHRCSVYRHPGTGRVSPWYFTVDNNLEKRLMTPTFSTNDAEMELAAVLAGQAIGQLANFSAAAHLRAGRLVPMLIPHLSAHYGLHIYYGSRASQPRRVRAFVDLAVKRLRQFPDVVLTQGELLAAARRAQSAQRRQPAAPG